jgi:anaerobic selenocysteine-containing dehydrogenase
MESSIMSKVEIKRAICTFCASNCGVLVHVKDGRPVKIEGNREHSISRGFICQRIPYAIKWLYHPEQLKYPLKRMGERGEGRWQRLTWDQAWIALWRLDGQTSAEFAKFIASFKNKLGS